MPAPTYLLASADAALRARVEPVLVSAGAQVALALSAQAALAAITGPHPPDLALLDSGLPGMPLEQLLVVVCCEDFKRQPLLLIAESVTAEWLARVDEGILDDLIPRHAEGAYWQFRASRALQAYRMRNELGALREDEARNQARNAERDRLTGVYRREELLALLFRETDRVQRLHGALALLLFAVDHFGDWTRWLGGDACDEMLRDVARRAARLLRSYDLMGRTGEAEFLIALPGCSMVNAVTLAERLRVEVFSAPYHAGAEGTRLSACFGIAQSRGRSPVVVVREAEQALARAREAGPETIQTFDGSPLSAPAPATFVASASGEKLVAW